MLDSDPAPPDLVYADPGFGYRSVLLLDHDHDAADRAIGVTVMDDKLRGVSSRP